MATTRDPKVAIAPAYAAEARRARRPAHRFNLKTRPYQIQPFLLAPVLPGETLQNIMMQCQTWSDPLKADLRNVGWWNEYYFFYVKHRDLEGWDNEAGGLGFDLADMMLNPAKDMSAHESIANTQKTYSFIGGINFTAACMKRVVEEYFRDEGEDWDNATLDGMPLARIYGRGSSDWTEKITLDSDYEDRRVDLDVDGDGTITVDEVGRAYQQWAAMYDAGLTEMDYQDFIATYGAKVREAEESVNLHRPEDIAYHREFTYPTNTVEPTTGVPAVAVGWRTAKRLDKRVYCAEPGFLVGYTVQRPKVYLRPQKGSVACSMTDVMSWLPALLNDQMNVSHKQFAAAEGPLQGLYAEPYWVDLRDLLLYGDQYVNYDTTTAVPFLNLPTAANVRRYAAEADIDALFSGAANEFLHDGICTLSILSRQKERGKNLVLGKA